jgi:hypothetical protein
LALPILIKQPGGKCTRDRTLDIAPPADAARGKAGGDIDGGVAKRAPRGTAPREAGELNSPGPISQVTMIAYRLL